MLKRKKFFLSLILVVSLVVMFGCNSGEQNDADAQKDGGDALAQEKVIEVIDENGNAQKIDLTSLASYSGTGILKKSTGTLVGPAEFNGPLLEDVLKEIGEFTNGDSLEVTASDGYVMNFTYEQVQGNVMTYNSDGKTLKIRDLDVILATDTSDEGFKETLPRIVFLGNDEPISDGHFWVRNVAKLRIIPAVEDWTIKLSGIEEVVLDRSTFESAATCPDSTHPAQKYEVENKDGSTDIYEGLPLWLIVSMIDGADSAEGHYRFNNDLAEKNYTIEVIAKDGFSAELNSQDTAYNDEIILAYLKNGEPLSDDEGPLKLVGTGLPSKKASVKQIAEIKLTNLPQ